MMIVKQFYHEKANLIWRFSAFQKSREACYNAFSFCTSCLLDFETSNLPSYLLTNMNRNLQGFCYQADNSILSNVLNQSFATESKKWGLIIYDFTRENRPTPTVNSLFLSPLFLLTVRGKY